MAGIGTEIFRPAETHRNRRVLLIPRSKVRILHGPFGPAPRRGNRWSIQVRHAGEVADARGVPSLVPSPHQNMAMSTPVRILHRKARYHGVSSTFEGARGEHGFEDELNRPMAQQAVRGGRPSGVSERSTNAWVKAAKRSRSAALE